jgi:type I restriction enzyme S subunit
MRQYKDSGIEWIGKIPDTWDIKRLKEIFVERNNRDAKGKTLLSVSQYYGIKPKAETDIADSHVAESYDDYKVVEKGDFVMNIMLAWNGSYAVSDYEGIVSPAYCVYQFRKDCCHKYLHYLLRTDGYQTAFKTMSRGIIDSRLRLYPEQFYTFNTIFPPVSEQQRIADYLDEKCGEIDSLIALQEQMIEKLKAYKQSVITEAVTTGLDPNAKLVPSGINWIGEIPEGWEVIKTKYIADKIFKGNGITKEEVFIDGDIPCVRYGEIYSKYTQAFKTCFSATNLDIQKSPQYFHYGDILCAGTGELVEEIGKSIVYLGDQECLAGGDIIVIRHHQDPSFLNYALNSNYAQTQKSRGKAKLKVVHISAFEIGSTYILLPPLSEQKTIASYLNEKCADIDRLIEIKQQKIEKLKDYKKSVIYEAVTGKIDII